jgi:Zn finger protein HypA/HybF involved in hydrogenase expression
LPFTKIKREGETYMKKRFIEAYSAYSFDKSQRNNNLEIIDEDNETDYIDTRLNDKRVRMMCNFCGYRFFSRYYFSSFDNLEGFDENEFTEKCPNCGSDDVEEI